MKRIIVPKIRTEDGIIDVDYKVLYEDSLCCPHCKKNNLNPAIFSYAKYMTHELYKDYNNYYLDIVFVCVNCNRTFTAKYYSDSIKSHYRDGIVEVCNPSLIFPIERVDKVALPNNICEVSPNFVKIYTQAYNIETILEDRENAAMIYRKALEFLIKDFLINHQKISKELVIKENLQKLINEHFTGFNDILTETATLVYWLGNDYSHYEKKHEDLSFDDLKEFLDLFISRIDSIIKEHRIKEIFLQKKKNKNSRD